MKTKVIILCLIFLLVGRVGATGLININTAGTDDLDTLPGIGTAYAERIIDYREANGNFQKIEDIKNVSGIGETTFNKIKGMITVGGATESTLDKNSEDAVLSQTSEKFNKKKLTVSIGKDRTVTAGSPTEFSVETNLENSRAAKYFWNFGDGSEDQGEAVIHTYEYPGEYVVILKAFNGDTIATSRVEVKVIEPNLTITFVSQDRIEIFNQTKYEVNLFGRGLVYGSDIYAFPKDTIIKEGEKLSFSSRVTGFRPLVQNVSLIILGEKRPFDKKTELIIEKQNQISSIKLQIQNILSQMPTAEISNTEQSNEELNVKTKSDSNLPNITVKETENKQHNWIIVLKKFFLSK